MVRSAFVLYVLANIWVGWWFLRALSRKRRGFGAVVFILILFLAAAFPVSYYFPSLSWATSPGALWLTGFPSILILVLIFDIADALKWYRRRRIPVYEKPRWLAITLVVAVPLALSVLSWINARTPVVVEYNLDIPVSEDVYEGLPSKSLKLGVLADAHIDSDFGTENLRKAIDLLIPENPDAVIFLGDMIDDDALDTASLRSIIRKISPPLGIIGILGNHEYIIHRTGGVENSLRILDEMGIDILRDEWLVLGDRILLIGRDDYAKEHVLGESRLRLIELLSQIPADAKRLPLVVLDHQPFDLNTPAREGAALQISGHTHNGQIWPMNWYISLFFDNSSGYSRIGRSQFVVGSGLGTWGIHMRNTSFSEVLIINLKFICE